MCLYGPLIGSIRLQSLMNNIFKDEIKILFYFEILPERLLKKNLIL
jgi:hypothetical protein